MDQVALDIQKKIERERNIIMGSTNLKKSVTNVAVLQKCNTAIREAQQNIAYLEDMLHKLQLQEQPEQQVTRLSTISPNEKRFSRLDLVKYECPSLSQRIQYMLQQLEFKLQVEKQYEQANDKLSKLYEIEGDRGSSRAAEGGARESKSRVQLLTKTLKKYQGLNIDLDQFKDQDMLTPQLKFQRKQLTGTLHIGLSAIRDVDHISSSLFSRKPETFVVVKVDDNVMATSKMSRTDRWNEEFNIFTDKGNEVEITIYDRVDNQNHPVAVLWFLLSDVAEEMRKKKAPGGASGWVNASRVVSSYGGDMSNPGSAPATATATADQLQQPLASTSNDAKVTTSNWFVLEPAGQILLTLGFEKTAAPNRKLMGGLDRHGAIKRNEEDVYEQHGHHFVQKQFYNIMCCAYCGDFLRYTGFQCQDCKFLCHKKCYPNVVTKCISKSSADIDPDEAKLNHRIPHIFETVPNHGTKWCCHCGYILPWSRNKVRKCSECGIVCHAACAHLVPDFCGMSMEMASKVLATIKSAKASAKKLPSVPRLPSTIPLTPTNGKMLPPQPSHSGESSPEHNTPVNSFNERQQSQGTQYGSPERKSHYSMDQQSLDNGKSMHSIDQKSMHSMDRRSRHSMELLGVYGDSHDQENEPRKTFDPRQSADSRRSENRESYDQYDQYQKFLQKQQEDENQRQADLREQQRQDIQRQWFEEAQKKTQETERVSVSTDTLDVISPVSNRDSRHSELSGESNNRSLYLQTGDHSPTHQKHVSPHTHKKKKSPKRRKVSLDDFVLLKVLGKGNFGKVLLAKSKNTEELCAIKVLKKDHIIKNHDIESARAEKKVFLLANKAHHPFLTNLYCSFQTENRIYFAMEFIGGGDLMWHVQKQRLSVKRAKFYAAEVLLALKYFHENGVVYRDLKLENILLTAEGHIKIADYGLCKDEMWQGNTTGTFCGTPEFMAPEILKEQPYTKAVDWWAFGVLLYQMLLCQSPFSGDDEDEVFNAILTDEPLYPIDMAADIVQIFQGLLTKDPERRLGAGPRDALEIMEEPFFRNINFDDIINMRVAPPYKPVIKSVDDTSFFEKEFTSAPPTLTPLPSVLSSKMQEEFRGFSYMPEDLTL